MDMVKYKGLVLALAAAALMGMGCGDDESSATDAGKDSGEPGEPTTQMCIDMAKELGSKAPQTTIDCLCDKCLQQMNDCNADEGCVEIRDCSDRTGCRGQLCYFATPECRTIIDKHGATGLSTTLATQLNDCNASMCEGMPDAGGKDASSEEDAATGGDSGTGDAG